MSFNWTNHVEGDNIIEELDIADSLDSVMLTVSFQHESENIYDEVSIELPHDTFKDLVTKLYKIYG